MADLFIMLVENVWGDREYFVLRAIYVLGTDIFHRSALNFMAYQRWDLSMVDN